MHVRSAYLDTTLKKMPPLGDIGHSIGGVGIADVCWNLELVSTCCQCHRRARAPRCWNLKVRCQHAGITTLTARLRVDDRKMMPIFGRKRVVVSVTKLMAMATLDDSNSFVTMETPLHPSPPTRFHVSALVRRLPVAAARRLRRVGQHKQTRSFKADL